MNRRSYEELRIDWGTLAGMALVLASTCLVSLIFIMIYNEIILALS